MGFQLNPLSGLFDLVGSSSGTVTSVGLSLPSIFTVTGSPVTTSGTLSATLNVQAANKIFAGPTTGVSSVPTFRSLVSADIPDLSAIYVTQSEVGAPSGVASLDVSGKIPVSQLPSVVMEYQSNWNPNTNTPTLVDGVGTNGSVYYVSALKTGTVSGLTDPSMVNFQIGDLVIYSDSISKYQLTTPAAGVSFVNGAQGAVTVNAINQLTGDVTAGPSSGSASAAATVTSVGGSAAADIHTAELAANAATNLNTISTIVKRDSSGNFSAGTITAALTGNVTGNVSGSAATFTGNLSGDVTGTQSSTAISDTTVTGKLLTGYSSTTGTISSSDSLLTAIEKLNGNSAAISGSAITALTGDGTASGPGSSALTLTTVNSNVGSFGSASSSPSFTVNAKGLITAASSSAIQIAESQVTNLVSDLAGKQPVGSYLTSVSVASSNGLSGSSSGGLTPILTLSTTITGILQGNGTAISAASTTGSGNVVLATSPTLTSPIVGTQSPNDASTKAASTAYVDTAVSTAGANYLLKANNLSDVSNQQTALNNLSGTQSSGKYLRSNGTNTSLTTIQVADVPTLNQNTSGSAASLSATLAVTSGGTGLTTLTANNVILGNGTSNPNFVAPSTSGNVLTSNGTTWISSPASAGSPIYAKYAIAGAGVAISSTQPANFATQIFDSNSAVTTGSSWKFTAPATKIYHVDVSLITAGGLFSFFLYKNGSLDTTLATTTPAGGYNSGSTLVSLAANDFIDIRSDNSETIGNNTFLTISIFSIN